MSRALQVLSPFSFVGLLGVAPFFSFDFRVAQEAAALSVFLPVHFDSLVGLTGLHRVGGTQGHLYRNAACR